MKPQKRRWVADPASIYKVMSKVQPFTPAELVAIETPVKLSFERIKCGNGQEADFHTLAGAINVALIRSEDIDPLCEQTCIQAQDALMRCLDRHVRTGQWGFDGPALQEIPAAIDLYDQLLQLSTPLQMQQAMNETIARMSRGQTIGVQ